MHKNNRIKNKLAFLSLNYIDGNHISFSLKFECYIFKEISYRPYLITEF